jgi:hypothetical protein
MLLQTYYIYISWEPVNVNPVPSKVDEAGAIIYQQLIAVGGCNAIGVSGNACLQGDSYVINTANRQFIAPAPCPVPRVSRSRLF